LRIALNADLHKVWFGLSTTTNPWSAAFSSDFGPINSVVPPVWAPTPSSVTGSASAGTSGAGPVISGPASGTVAALAGLTVSGCTVADTIWPRSGNVTLNVTALAGAVTMTLSSTPVAGSGTSHIQLNDTSANVQSALGTLSFTAAMSNDTISITVTDQVSQSATLQIPITVRPLADPAVPSNTTPGTIFNISAEGGTKLAVLKPGSYSVHHARQRIVHRLSRQRLGNYYHRQQRHEERQFGVWWQRHQCHGILQQYCLRSG
jgi:hypothetical protein